MRSRIVAALLVTLTLSACKPEPQTSDVAIAVPNVVGMQYEDAVAGLQAKGFVVNRIDVANDAVEAGTVNAQDPPPNTVADTGSSVTVRVAGGD
jgi:beta-lactam-binding protein with PASTA domain